jgi:hypothetical protein
MYRLGKLDSNVLLHVAYHIYYIFISTLKYRLMLTKLNHLLL